MGEESRELLAGEVHFWRLDTSVWRRVLEGVRELGLDIVSTYVAWNVHELAPGEFDFEGRTDPRRDLLGFLQMAREMGFWVLLRPGPYIYAEWPNSGIPDRVVPLHRTHPEFRREAELWIRAVSESVRPFLATHGGPVVLVQADNEADAWSDVYRSALGTSSNAVEALTSPTQLPRLLEHVRLRQAYATEIVRWTVAAYRKWGIDVPIYANTYSAWEVQDWRAIGAECDLVAPDIYPTSALAYSADEHRQVLDAVRYARVASSMAFVAEFESGIWHGWHTRIGALAATHYVLLGLSALQAGVHGWSWYMLVNRDNWYMSPLNELGVKRPDLAPAFEALVRDFRALQPSGLQKQVWTGVTFDVLHRGASIETDSGDALLRALYAADIDYEVFDVDSGAPATPLLLYAGPRWLSPEAQARLRDYAAKGGTLVFLQTLPLADERLQPLNVLGIAEPTGVTTAASPQRVTLGLGLDSITLSSPAVLVYDTVPGEPIVAERVAPDPPTQEGGYLHVQLPVGQRWTCGYVQSIGAGRIVVLGVAPTPELLVALHHWLGVPIPSRFAASGLTSAVFQRNADDEVVAICTNVTDFDGDTTLELDVPGHVSRLSVRVPPHSGTWLTVPRA